MKKQAIGLVVLMALGLTTAKADVIGLKLGIDYLSSDTELSNIDFGSESNLSLYGAFEHPIPFVPNFKLRYTDINAGDNGDINQYDLILYYELFDNDVFSLDAGLDLQYFDQSYKGYFSDYNDTIPSLYAAAQVSLSPAFELFAEGSFGAWDDNDSIDVQAGVAWKFKFLTDESKVKLGYRRMDYSFQEGWQKTDYASDSVFLGFELGL